MSSTNRRQFMLLSAGAGVGAFALASKLLGGMRGETNSGRALRRFERSSRAFGTDVSMLVLHEIENVAQAALTAAFEELDTVERVMSLYQPESQICELNRTGVLANPHAYLLEVLTAAQEMSARSGGDFDVTVQPLWEVYTAAKKSGALPSDAQLSAARAKVDYRKLEVRRDRVRLAPGMSITLNGIAQGFATDLALRTLRAHGVVHSLLNTGEIGALGRKSDGSAWKVGIQHPRYNDAFIASAKLVENDAGHVRCMATSGDYETSFSEDRKFNHIFDPRTGASPELYSSVTILSPSAMTADALTKVAFVGGAQRGLRVVEETADTDALFVRKDGSVLATRGFPWAEA
jgi:FAD:protein FMN transferase